MSIDNIKWSCLYSGAGILHILTEKEIKKLFNSIDFSDEFKNMLQDIILIKCLYKKGKPVFSCPPAEIINPGKYMWEFESFNKVILPSTQAFAILSLLKAAELIQDEDKILACVMVRSAEIYYDFTTTYMRNEDGLFVSVENKSKYINGELKIKPVQKDIKLIDQVYMHEAFLYLYYLTSNKENNICYSSGCEKYKTDARNLFEYIFNNYNILLEMSSKEISFSISSLARCCSFEKDLQQKAYYQHLIAVLCAELESRIKITGEVEKNYNDFAVSSMATHFRAASSLAEGYLETRIDKFKESSLKIFNLLYDLYDPTYGLFIQGDYSKVSYSIRNIVEIIKCLFILYTLEPSEKLLEILNEFYKSSIETSGILQSISSKHLNFSGYDVTMPDNIPVVDETDRAPVFVKSFRITYKKVSAPTVSKQFNSFYSLYSSYLILHYISSTLKPKLQEKPLQAELQTEEESSS